MARTLLRIVLTVSATLIAAINAGAQEHCSTAHFRGVFGALAQGDLIFVPPGSGIPTGPTARVARPYTPRSVSRGLFFRKATADLIKSTPTAP